MQNLNLSAINVSKYDNEVSTKPGVRISLASWLFQGDDTLRDVVNQIRLKEDVSGYLNLFPYQYQLPMICPNGICGGKGRVRPLAIHSPLFCIDINQKDNPGFKNLEEIKKRVSEKEYVLYCGVSFDGKSLHCLIPISCPQLHSRHFYAIQKDFANMDIIIDLESRNESRKILWTYDSHYYLNQEAVQYDRFVEGPCEVDFRELLKYIRKESLRTCIDALEEEESVIQRVRKYLDRIKYSYIELCNTYDWVMLCSILKILLGEKIGRILFHDISRLNSEYDYKQTDFIFDVCPSKEDEQDLSSDFIYDLLVPEFDL
jgi:hypothetical protein